MLPAIEHTAVRATHAGGRHLRDRFRANDDAGEFSAHDVKTPADRASERRMLGVIEETFPDHAVYAEESGERGDSGGEYRWVVDPLDGTNNFVAGLPTFASSVAVLREGVPVVASVYTPIADETYVARRGAGVEYDGEAVATGSDRSPEEATVGFVIGHDVKGDPERAARTDAVRTALEAAVKRVVPSWAPTVYWGLLARGRIDAMVTLFPDREEQHAGELLAREAGAAVREDGPLGVFAANGDLRESCWQSADSYGDR